MQRQPLFLRRAEHRRLAFVGEGLELAEIKILREELAILDRRRLGFRIERHGSALVAGADCLGERGLLRRIVRSLLGRIVRFFGRRLRPQGRSGKGRQGEAGKNQGMHWPQHERPPRTWVRVLPDTQALN
ncbi:hypothetical protein MPL1032_20524 [Mesorhizobium plurifarium]|uniref:Uncharacterized protein n=1 Tax=Mesorhizobium plurifarium TaxID=69974 RepID=A0A0K2VX86_MESPL|nr:hypothetical protein MPL1032_20524 [Mesorhizobium plurifarium]